MYIHERNRLLRKGLTNERLLDTNTWSDEATQQIKYTMDIK